MGSVPRVAASPRSLGSRHSGPDRISEVRSFDLAAVGSKTGPPNLATGTIAGCGACHGRNPRSPVRVREAAKSRQPPTSWRRAQTTANRSLSLTECCGGSLERTGLWERIPDVRGKYSEIGQIRDPGAARWSILGTIPGSSAAISPTRGTGSCETASGDLLVGRSLARARAWLNRPTRPPCRNNKRGGDPCCRIAASVPLRESSTPAERSWPRGPFGPDRLRNSPTGLR